MATNFDYSEAFSRNLGLITAEEQERIRNSRIAIAGMGGCGGLHFITLVRMGFSKFNISDFDSFELVNFNRQYGAFIDTVGRKKTECMVEIAKRINPEIDVQVFANGIRSENIAAFLAEVDCFVDGLEIFETDIRRELYAYAAKKGIYCTIGAPLGFSAAWITFDPQKMSFDDYFGFSNHQDKYQKFAAFLLGLAPSALHLKQIDRTKVSIRDRRGPSLSLACHFATGAIGAEVVKIILGRGRIHTAPAYSQFDAYRGKFKLGRVPFGSRNPWFRFKSWILGHRLRRLDLRAA
jgi:molybdopterin/thiamine biosynthesis adenylyltransferase